MKRRLLITGFDPFGGEQVNPAWETVKNLPDQVGDFSLCKLEIPTVFSLAAQTVLKKAWEFDPHVILCVGQAGGRSAVTPERIGINFRNASIPDNVGNQPAEETIVPGGADGYFSTVPVSAMAQAIMNAGIPAAVSNTAGTFVCNETLYLLLHHYLGTPVQVGFIHVPYFPEQGSPNLSPAETLRALEAAITAL